MKDAQPEVLVNIEYRLSDPFRHLADKLDDEKFRLEIASREPDNKTLMQALAWAKRLGMIGGYDIVKDVPL